MKDFSARESARKGLSAVGIPMFKKRLVLWCGAALLSGAVTSIVSAGAPVSGQVRDTQKALPITTLTWALQGPVGSLDYATSPATYTTGIVMSLVTQPLEAVTGSNQFEPILATSVTAPNPTTLRYTIRKGVKFSDGTPLTAQDVVWSIEHAATPPLASSTEMPEISGVSAAGPYSVVVKLKQPNPLARAEIDMLVLVQEKKFALAHLKVIGTPQGIPIGSGPYVVTSDTDQTVTLGLNKDYWGRAPKVQQIDFPFISEDTTRLLAVRSGSVDVAQVTNLPDLSQWKSIPGASIYEAPAGFEDFLGFDTSQPPFNDVHVRRAIAYATDKAGMAKAGFDDHVMVIKSMVTASQLSDVAGSTAAATSFLNSLPSYGFNESAAKKQLAESKYPHGFAMTLDYINSVPWIEDAALLLQNDLKPLGIKVTLKPVTLNVWFGDYFEHKLTGMNIVNEFGFSVDDPSSLLTPLVTPASDLGSQNFSNWTPAPIEKAATIVNSDAASNARWANSKTILRGIADDVPYIPLFSEYFYLALKSGYAFTTPQGISVNDLTNGEWISMIKRTA